MILMILMILIILVIIVIVVILVILVSVIVVLSDLYFVYRIDVSELALYNFNLDGDLYFCLSYIFSNCCLQDWCFLSCFLLLLLEWDLLDLRFISIDFFVSDLMQANLRLDLIETIYTGILTSSFLNIFSIYLDVSYIYQLFLLSSFLKYLNNCNNNIWYHIAISFLFAFQPVHYFLHMFPLLSWQKSSHNDLTHH